jgi:hypothetical protein
LPVRQQILFRGHGRRLGQKHDEHGVLRRKETYRVRCPSKRWHIQSAIFSQCHIPRFHTSRPEVSAPEDRINFWVHIDNSMYHNGSTVTSKIKKNGISRMPHPPDSPDRSPCDFWLFGMLKQILRDREFSLSDEIDDAIV